jgi:hypothetical protein
MNRFQAMATIMAMLTDDGCLIRGSREYAIARKLVARKIERLGPDAALIQVVDRMAYLMDQIRTLVESEETRWEPSHFDF